MKYAIPWDAQVFMCQMHNGMVHGRHGQDFTQNAQKLVNALDSPSKVFIVRDIWIMLNHVSLVYDNFPIYQSHVPSQSHYIINTYTYLSNTL